MKIKNVKSILLLILLLIAFFTITVGNYKPKHSIYNEDEFGTSKLKERITQNSDIDISRLLISPFSLSENFDAQFVVIIGSERSYTSAEINAYRDFVREGGFLVIFEDFGPAKSIAESMGITFYSGMLRESNPLITVNRPTQFLIKDLTFSFFTGSQSDLLLLASEAAAIIDLVGLQEGTTYPLLATFPTAFIDRDNDNVMDSNDLQFTQGTPMGLFKQFGDGYLTVISDSSIPLNMYFNRQINVGDQPYNVPNIQWSAYLLSTLLSLTNGTSIVFDESHQEFVLSSGNGIINNLTSLWVGITNSIDFVGILFVVIVIFAILINRTQIIGYLSILRDTTPVKDETERFISNPTLAERTITEQYILFKRMGNGFLHVSNSELYNMLKDTGKADEFLDKIDKTYGSLEDINNTNTLLEVNQEMKQFVQNNLKKWL